MRWGNPVLRLWLAGIVLVLYPIGSIDNKSRLNLYTLEDYSDQALLPVGQKELQKSQHSGQNRLGFYKYLINFANRLHFAKLLLLLVLPHLLTVE